MVVSSDFLLLLLMPALGAILIIIVVELAAVFWEFARESMDKIRGGI